MWVNFKCTCAFKSRVWLEKGTWESAWGVNLPVCSKDYPILRAPVVKPEPDASRKRKEEKITESERTIEGFPIVWVCWCRSSGRWIGVESAPEEEEGEKKLITSCIGMPAVWGPYWTIQRVFLFDLWMWALAGERPGWIAKIWLIRVDRYTHACGYN